MISRSKLSSGNNVPNPSLGWTSTVYNKYGIRLDVSSSNIQTSLIHLIFMKTIIHLGYPPKFSKTNFIEFSWDDRNTEEKLETMVIKNLWGLSKVHYGLCENGWIGHFEFARETGAVLCRIALWDCFEDAIAYFIGYNEVARELGHNSSFKQSHNAMRHNTDPVSLATARSERHTSTLQKWPSYYRRIIQGSYKFWDPKFKTFSWLFSKRIIYFSSLKVIKSSDQYIPAFF